VALLALGHKLPTGLDRRHLVCPHERLRVDEYALQRYGYQFTLKVGIKDLLVLCPTSGD